MPKHQLLKRERGNFMEKDFKFEEAMKRLDEIVNTLESGKVGLDESLALYEEGIKLVKLCDNKLKEVEAKAVKILENSQEMDFDVAK